MSEQREAALQYARIRYKHMILEMFAGFAILLLYQLIGTSTASAHFWTQVLKGWPLQLAAYLACFGILYYVLLLPSHIYTSYFLEHRFGLSRLTFKGWCVREAKRLAVSSVLSLLIIEGLYAILHAIPQFWPIVATVAWICFSVVLAKVFPTLLLPIFYKTTRLEDTDLVNKLMELCKRVGLPVLGVYRFQLGAETRKANAALTGLGSTRRVLLADTLIEEFTPDEIEGVLAHELGHHHYQHIRKFLVLSAIGSWLAFSLIDLVSPVWLGPLGLEGLTDIAGFPMLALGLSILGLIGMPIQNAISRHFEWQCDHFAVAKSSKPAAFADALRRLSDLNLADPNPPAWIEWLFFDHPAITKRIQAAEVAGQGSGTTNAE